MVSLKVVGLIGVFTLVCGQKPTNLNDENHIDTTSKIRDDGGKKDLGFVEFIERFWTMPAERGSARNFNLIDNEDEKKLDKTKKKGEPSFGKYGKRDETETSAKVVPLMKKDSFKIYRNNPLEMEELGEVKDSLVCDCEGDLEPHIKLKAFSTHVYWFEQKIANLIQSAKHFSDEAKNVRKEQHEFTKNYPFHTFQHDAKNTEYHDAYHSAITSSRTDVFRIETAAYNFAKIGHVLLKRYFPENLSDDSFSKTTLNYFLELYEFVEKSASAIYEKSYHQGYQNSTMDCYEIASTFSDTIKPTFLQYGKNIKALEEISDLE
ncbi:hypothetical protein BB559_003161 [Furculomyces boomerangus]|uniref:Glycolipid transfer protein domain-containing protein n=2 Tax=Harpellales TaxID=61421 RepID=A0A2T9YN54_9FUNG|nr:hypothetical protein BB559_003161 [Furculomyces boomerangus]PVZ99854.1 hypothetical protein BB558_004102 [Smittium angustum]